MNRNRLPRALGTAALAALLGLPLAPQALANDTHETVAPLLWMPAMNVFRRHSVPSEEMFAFYRDVLGLEQLGTFAVGNGGVSRFQIGRSELKLTLRVEDRDYVPGGVKDATGVRLLTFFFPDQTALEERFREHGLPQPAFQPVEGTRRSSALVQDPDGQWVELVAAPGEPPATYQQLEIGLTVSDLAASHDFYYGFVGLSPQAPVHDPHFDTLKHSYRNGSTIVSLRSFGDELPADTGSGGIQYVVSNADKVGELVEQRDIVVDQPLSNLPGFDLRTIWVDDPDGITNYFAQTGASAREPAQK